MSPSDISDEEFSGLNSLIDVSIHDFNLYNEEFKQ
jgi:hypothetical protein